MKPVRLCVTALIVFGIVISLTGVVFADQEDAASPMVQSSAIVQKPSSIQVISTPLAASVSLDGVPVNGLTPVTVNGISPGNHTLVVSKTGFADWSGNVMVKTGLKSSVYATLKPLYGTISVQSTPSGGTVYIDNVTRGTTNVVIPGIISGLHQVRVEKSGYLDWESPVTVTGGQTSSVKATLKPDSGSVQVNSNPQGGKISLDGTTAGTSPALLTSVTSGNHTITIKKTGYLAYAANVTIKPGEKKFLFAILEKIPKPSHVYNQSDDGKTYPVSQQDIVQVNLPENGSTGAIWYINATPGIEVLEKSFKSSNPWMTGAGGTATWMLKISGTGTQEFSGVNKQGWMPPSANDRIYSITFIVD